MEKTCKHCDSNSCQKNGLYKGFQRYICTVCRRTFCDKPRKYSQEFKEKVVKLYLRGTGMTALADVFHLSSRTVLLWIHAFREKLEQQMKTVAEQLKNNSSPDIIEMDEIYTYCGKKKIESSFGLLILDEKLVLLALPSVKE